MAYLLLWYGWLHHWESEVWANVAEPPPVQPSPSPSPVIASPPPIYPITVLGAIVNGKKAPESIPIEGNIQGDRPLDLGGWLLPFDTVLDLLDIQQQELAEGNLKLSSPYLTIRFDPRQLISHPQLGRSISIRDLQKFPGVKVEFAFSQGSLKFSYDLPKNAPKPKTPPPPVKLDGLAEIDPPTAGLSAIQQRINLSGAPNSQVNYQGEFKAVGTILGASWYLRADLPKLSDSLTWSLTDAIAIDQNPTRDWIGGSQSPFWRRQGNPTGTYWGVTTIQREGFTPPVSLYGNNFVPSERLQSNVVGRTVAGRAAPGTVVRLAEGFSSNILGQVLVDSSGVFRFENVETGGNGLGNNYRLLLYPRGQLTADPEVRDVTFTTVPGQLPVGAGAWIASVGANYNRQPQNFVGKFDRVQGGMAYRRGVDESLTVGGGLVYDPTVRGLGDIFWQPVGMPLKASISAVTGDRWDVVSNVNYQPTPNFSANFNSDRLSSRVNLNWRISPQISATGNYDSLSGISVGGNYSFSLFPQSYSNLFATFDSDSRLRWNASHQQGEWQARLQGNEVSFLSEVAYRLPKPPGVINHELVSNYQLTTVGATTNLSQLLWRYQTANFRSELGYGISGFSSGVNSALGLSFDPGLEILGRYQGISAFSNRANFSLEFQSTLDLQGGVRLGTTRVEDLRTQGGITIQPFLDRNLNGKLDGGEDTYWHPSLVTLDNKPLDVSRTKWFGDRAEVRTLPGSYRVDFNPAHFPPQWRTSLQALRVNVAPGSFTTIPLPLIPYYNVKGIVSDRRGKPLVNTEIIATPIAGLGNAIATNTDANGKYEFKALDPGIYRIKISGKYHPLLIPIDANSPTTQEVNF